VSYNLPVATGSAVVICWALTSKVTMRLMPNGRVKGTGAEWRALITKQERPRLSAAALCREEGLHSPHFLK